MSKTTRVNLTLTEEVLDMLDFCIKERYGTLPRATAVQLILKHALDQEIDYIKAVRDADERWGDGPIIV